VEIGDYDRRRSAGDYFCGQQDGELQVCFAIWATGKFEDVTEKAGVVTKETRLPSGNKGADVSGP